MSADQNPNEEVTTEENQTEDAAVAVMEADPNAETPGDEEPRVDEPLGEPTADVLSTDPAGALASDSELRAALETLLFTSPEPLTPAKLSRALGDIDTKRIKAALRELGGEYEAQRRGLQIVEIAGGFQMATQERFAEYVLALGAKKKSQSLSGPMLETLSIIAYRQPVIRAVVEAIRGVESSGVIRNLLDLGLVEVTGRKEVIGRPQLYGTSEKFLKTFGLKNLKQLPTVRGLKEKLRSERDAVDEKASLTHHVADGGAGLEEESKPDEAVEDATGAATEANVEGPGEIVSEAGNETAAEISADTASETPIESVTESKEEVTSEESSEGSPADPVEEQGEE